RLTEQLPCACSKLKNGLRLWSVTPERALRRKICHIYLSADLPGVPITAAMDWGCISSAPSFWNTAARYVLGRSRVQAAHLSFRCRWSRTQHLWSPNKYWGE